MSEEDYSTIFKKIVERINQKLKDIQKLNKELVQVNQVFTNFNQNQGCCHQSKLRSLANDYYKIKKNLQEIQTKQNEFLFSLNKLLKDLNIKNKQEVKYQKDKASYNQRFNQNMKVERDLFQQESGNSPTERILRCNQESTYIIKLFSQQLKLPLLVKIELKFRASEHQFDTNYYHQLCDRKHNTLTLIETQFGKKIGGFTSAASKNDSDQFPKDDTNTAFLFSISNKHLFELTEDQQQRKHIVQYKKQCGPIFGEGNDLMICDKADINKQSYSNIGITFVHPQYPYNKQESWQKFTGGKSRQFKVKDWQVYQITFKKQKIQNHFINMQGIKQSQELNKFKLNSKIAIQKNHVQALMRFLSNNKFYNEQNGTLFHEKRTVKDIELKYRASQQNFNTGIYHQKCDGISHTMLLVKTQFDTLIGAYTPIASKKSDDGQYAQQEGNQTFIFSLTNTDKLLLKTHFSQTVYHHSKKGPCFGKGPDLQICDKANQQSNSVFNIGGSFANKKYSYEQNQIKNTWRHFIGSQSTNKFKVQEWEIFQITFE